MTTISRQSVEEVLAAAAGVPAIDRFPTVDALVADFVGVHRRHPSSTVWRRVGTSRLGEPIHCLTVPGGSDHALVFAGVHPNEPIGGLTARHLAETMAADERLRGRLGYTWHIIPCIDPDGMRLNEGWFSGTLSRAEYGRQFYRPAPNEQVEWTFPLEYESIYFDRVLPETLALMRLIDDVRPTFMCSLHNGEMGGVYYYVSHDLPELYPYLAALPAQFGIPLDRGEPEMPYTPQHAPAVFGQSGMADAYDYRRSLGLDPADGLETGDSSHSYTAKWGTFGLVSELPYWTHPDADNHAPTEISYAETLRRRAVGLQELADVLQETLDRAKSDLTADTPFLRASAQFTPHFAQFAAQERARADRPESARPATAAEVLSAGDLIDGFRMRFGGMMLRVLEAEIAIGHATPVIRSAHARLDAIYDTWASEATAELTPLPIGHLVGVQYGAILAAADQARGRFGPSTLPGG